MNAAAQMIEMIGPLHRQTLLRQSTDWPPLHPEHLRHRPKSAHFGVVVAIQSRMMTIVAMVIYAETSLDMPAAGG